MTHILLIIIAVLIAGCGQDPAKLQQVLVKAHGDAQTVLVTGCKDAPVIELATKTVLTFLPPGTTLDAVKAGVAVAEPEINAICAKVLEAKS